VGGWGREDSVENGSTFTLYFLLRPIVGGFLMGLPTFVNVVLIQDRIVRQLRCSHHKRFKGQAGKVSSATGVRRSKVSTIIMMTINYSYHNS
jgi:hypothetical protein